MAAAATPSAVPDWVRKNGEIFRTPPSGMDLSKRGQGRSSEGVRRNMVEQAANTGPAAAMARAEMSADDGMGSIDPPAFLPPASYYQDVRNHANIAATMLVTARRQVGFEPNLVGQELTSQQMEDFVTKFFRWIFELDNYWPYIDIKASQTMALWFHSVDENVSQFLAFFGGLANDVVQAWRQALTGTVKAASTYVTQNGALSQVSFQTDILDTSGNMNPAFPLSFGRTVQSSSNSPSDSVLTSGMMYRVDSNAIIAAADHFAQNGVTIFGARNYVAFVNSGGQ